MEKLDIDISYRNDGSLATDLGSIIASNLYRYLAFFKRFKILDTVCPKSGMCLVWSHYRVLLQVEDDLALRWYLDEAREIVRVIVRVMREISSVSSMPLRVTLTPQLQNWRMC